MSYSPACGRPGKVRTSGSGEGIASAPVRGSAMARRCRDRELGLHLEGPAERAARPRSPRASCRRPSPRCAGPRRSASGRSGSEARRRPGGRRPRPGARSGCAPRATHARASPWQGAPSRSRRRPPSRAARYDGYVRATVIRPPLLPRGDRDCRSSGPRRRAAVTVPRASQRRASKKPHLALLSPPGVAGESNDPPSVLWTIAANEHVSDEGADYAVDLERVNSAWGASRRKSGRSAEKSGVDDIAGRFVFSD